jgi:hypothetical protein
MLRADRQRKTMQDSAPSTEVADGIPGNAAPAVWAPACSREIRGSVGPCLLIDRPGWKILLLRAERSAMLIWSKATATWFSYILRLAEGGTARPVRGGFGGKTGTFKAIA